VLVVLVLVVIVDSTEELDDAVEVEVGVGAAEGTVLSAAGKRFPIGHPRGVALHGLLIQHP
jgi:hypothetical protein